MKQQLQNVLAYYKSTNSDYERYWSGKKAQALHFGFYDSPQTKHEESLLKMNEELAKLVNIAAIDVVFDAGCGYGGSCLWLAENISCSTTGMSIVPYQVEKARGLASKLPTSPKPTFIEGDYASTELPDESFTVVWGLESIVHCENKLDFIREAYRLLKPGGRILIAEYLLRDKPPTSEGELKKLQPWLDGWMMPDLLAPSQYKKLLRDAGFSEVKVRDLSGSVEPSLKKCKRNSGLAMPFVGPLRSLGLIDQIRKDYTIANYQLYDTFKQGLWFYGVVVAVKPS